VKVSPLANWTKKEVWGIISKENVPYNPLHDQGYPSIGCWPCTRRVMEGEDERAGRWSGKGKTECGLHTTEEKDGSGI
jgi:phosphoadenosine phosphosulfate reductase